MNIIECCCLEPGVIAKSNIILDVKPWDDETGKCSWSTSFGSEGGGGGSAISSTMRRDGYSIGSVFILEEDSIEE